MSRRAIPRGLALHNAVLSWARRPCYVRPHNTQAAIPAPPLRLGMNVPPYHFGSFFAPFAHPSSTKSARQARFLYSFACNELHQHSPRPGPLFSTHSRTFEHSGEDDFSGSSGAERIRDARRARSTMRQLLLQPADGRAVVLRAQPADARPRHQPSPLADRRAHRPMRPIPPHRPQSAI